MVGEATSSAHDVELFSVAALEGENVLDAAFSGWVMRSAKDPEGAGVSAMLMVYDKELGIWETCAR